jgi:hypothetical protein
LNRSCTKSKQHDRRVPPTEALTALLAALIKSIQPSYKSREEGIALRPAHLVGHVSVTVATPCHPAEPDAPKLYAELSPGALFALI